MSSTWYAFTQKLASAGYTLEDLADNESLFRLVAEEICEFSPKQVNELQKEWVLHRSSRAWTSTIPRHQKGSEDGLIQSGTASVLSSYPASLVLARASAFLRKWSNARFSATKVTDVSLSRVLIQSFRERMAALHKPGCGAELMWKLCSPETLESIRNGKRLENTDDCDALCPSGIVLYRDNGTPSSFPGTTLKEVTRYGWALVGCDVAVGKSRRLEVDEITLLQNFPMEECFNSLHSDGYDSIRVVSRNAFVFFHPNQVIPRFIVNFHEGQEAVEEDDAHGLNNLTTGVNSSCTTFKAYGRDPMINERHLARSNVNHADKPSLQHIITCSAHIGKQVEFWCPNGKKLLCSHCLFYDGYSKSNCVLLTEAVRQEAPRLEQWVQNAAMFTKEIGTVEDIFRSAERDIDRCENERLGELQEQFKRIRIKVDALENDLKVQIESKGAQQRETLQNCMYDIHSTVDAVRQLIHEANGPLSKYRAGNMDHENTVAFLRVVQSAFGEWRGVDIPMYSIVSGWNRDVLKNIENLLEPMLIVETDGQVELPEAIDVNYLKN